MDSTYSDDTSKYEFNDDSNKVSGESALSAYLTTPSDSNIDDVRVIAEKSKGKSNHQWSQLADKFEENGILKDVRCIFNSKLVTVISGIEEGLPLVPRRRRGIGGEGERDIRFKILDALILEVLQWEGFTHTADMFIRESGTEFKNPPRDLFDAMLGPVKEKNKPVLLQLIKKKKL